MGNWINVDFNVPERLETDQFRLRMLTINDLVKDYDAVMFSRGELKGVFGPFSDWPKNDLTIEQDLIDLGWHQKEFQNRSSFAYTVMSLDESVCLGCVYIYPSKTPNIDATVMLWARSGSGLTEALIAAVKNWLDSAWPFANVAYPGIDISWEEWHRPAFELKKE